MLALQHEVEYFGDDSVKHLILHDQWGHDQPLSLDMDVLTEKKVIIVSLDSELDDVIKPFKRTTFHNGIGTNDIRIREFISLVPDEETKAFFLSLKNAISETLSDFMEKPTYKSVNDTQLYHSYYDENEQYNTCSSYTYYGCKNPDRDPIAEKENRRARKQKQRLERKSTASRAPVKYAERKCVGRQNFNFRK